MKENTGIFSHILFGQLSGEITGRYFQSQTQQAYALLRRLAGKFLPEALAIFVMGVVLFIGIALFLHQLAEYGL